MSDRPVLTPGPQHPITIEPEPRRVRVRIGDRVVADSTSAVQLQEASYPSVVYVPLADVERDTLQDSDHTTYCPYKGDASYYSLIGSDGAVAENKAWFYPRPWPAVATIADHVAFYDDAVTIEYDAA